MIDRPNKAIKQLNYRNIIPLKSLSSFNTATCTAANRDNFQFSPDLQVI